MPTGPILAPRTGAPAPLLLPLGLSLAGEAWWRANRHRVYLAPVIQALRILIEGTTAADLQAAIAADPERQRVEGTGTTGTGPVTTDVRTAARGAVTLAPVEVYRQLEWLYEWPDALLQEVIPGATPARIATARRVLDPGLSAPARHQARVFFLRERRADLVARRTTVETQLAELARTRTWAQAVVNRFEDYLTWFTHHQEKLDQRASNVSKALQSVAAVVAFVPVVGTAISLAITVVDVRLQYDRLEDSLEAMRGTVKYAETALVAVEVLKATEVAGVELLTLQQALVVEIENADRQLAILDPAAPPAAPPQALPAVPAATRGRGGWGLFLLLAVGGILVARRRS